MSAVLHEELYRGSEVLGLLARRAITICGAGALGANLAETLVRCGARTLTLIDQDRVEEQNLSTQPYGRSDIGASKARVLAHQLYRQTGLSVEAQGCRLEAGNARRLLRGAELVVDCFDNTASRACLQEICRAQRLELLHVGLTADFAEVIWDASYLVPEQLGRDGCDYPLARNIVLLAAAVAAESLMRFIARGERQSFTITLRDLTIRSLPD